MRQLLNSGRILILLSVIMFAQIPAFAEPLISTLSGSISHGSTVTISGAGFGTKNPARPLVWADFEQGLAPGNMGRKTSWDGKQNMEWSTECPADGVGTYCAKASNGSGPWAFRVDYQNWTNEGQKVYIYKVQRKNFLITSGNSQNWKIWRMWPSSGTNYPNIYASSSHSRVFVEKIGQESGYWANSRTGTTDWVTEELIFQASSAPNIKDGILEIRYDGVRKASGTVLTRSSSRPAYMVQNYVVHGVKARFDDWNTNNRMWVDDVYVDTTWARVMIGNAPTYTNSTILAPQIPLVWSETSITMTLNLGRLAGLENLYMYVVDENGNVRDIGYSLFGPNPPSGLTVR